MVPQAKTPFPDLQKMMPKSRRWPFASLRKSSRFGRSFSRGETAFTDMSVFDPVLDNRNLDNGSVSPSTGRPADSVKMGWCSNSLTGETSPMANESASLKSRSSTSGASITSKNHNASFDLEGLAIVEDDKVLLSAPSPAEVSPDSRRLPLRPTKRIAPSDTPALSDGFSSRNSSFSSMTWEQCESRPSSASSMNYVPGAPRASKHLSGSFNTLNGISIVASPHRPTSRSPNRRLSKSYDVEAFQLPYLPTLFPEPPSLYSFADLAEPKTKASLLSPHTLVELGLEVDPITVSVTPKRRASFDLNAIRISCYDRVPYVH